MKQRAASRAELFGDTYRAVVERIAANVRRLRDLRGWTQEEAAHQCNDLDLTLWRMVESGRTNITAATLARLVDGFAVDVGELFVPAPPLEKRPPGRPRRASSPPMAAEEGASEGDPRAEDAATAPEPKA